MDIFWMVQTKHVLWPKSKCTGFLHWDCSFLWHMGKRLLVKCVLYRSAWSQGVCELNERVEGLGYNIMCFQETGLCLQEWWRAAAADCGLCHRLQQHRKLRHYDGGASAAHRRLHQRENQGWSSKVPTLTTKAWHRNRDWLTGPHEGVRHILALRIAQRAVAFLFVILWAGCFPR